MRQSLAVFFPPKASFQEIRSTARDKLVIKKSLPVFTGTQEFFLQSDLPDKGNYWALFLRLKIFIKKMPGRANRRD